MKPVENIAAVLRHSWSFRLNVLLAFVAGGDASMTYAADGRWAPAAGVFAWSLFSAGARCVAQEKVSGAATEGGER